MLPINDNNGNRANDVEFIAYLEAIHGTEDEIRRFRKIEICVTATILFMLVLLFVVNMIPQ